MCLGFRYICVAVVYFVCECLLCERGRASLCPPLCQLFTFVYICTHLFVCAAVNKQKLMLLIKPAPGKSPFITMQIIILSVTYPFNVYNKPKSIDKENHGCFEFISISGSLTTVMLLIDCNPWIFAQLQNYSQWKNNIFPSCLNHFYFI